jgi:hypothetical protein
MDWVEEDTGLRDSFDRVRLCGTGTCMLGTDGRARQCEAMAYSTPRYVVSRGPVAHAGDIS